MADTTKDPEVNWDELKPQLIKMALELGPLVVFFIVNSRADIFVGTAWFMGAMVLSLALSWLLLKPDGTVDTAGMDFYELGRSGQIARVTGFFGPPPPIDP